RVRGRRRGERLLVADLPRRRRRRVHELDLHGYDLRHHAVAAAAGQRDAELRRRLVRYVVRIGRVYEYSRRRRAVRDRGRRVLAGQARRLHAHRVAAVATAARTRPGALLNKLRSWSSPLFEKARAPPTDSPIAKGTRGTRYVEILECQYLP